MDFGLKFPFKFELSGRSNSKFEKFIGSSGVGCFARGGRGGDSELIEWRNLQVISFEKFSGGG